MAGAEKMLVDSDLETDADAYSGDIPYIKKATLTTCDLIDAQKAIDDANAALRSVGLSPMAHIQNPADATSGHFTRGSRKGEAQVTVFNGCQNIHIGSNHVQTHYHHGPPATTNSKQKISKKLFPFLNVKEQLRQEQKSKLAENIGSVWRRLGRELGSSDGQLDAIHYDYRDEGLQEVSHQMIRKWEQKFGVDATIGVLVKALQKIGRCDIAETVFVQK